MGAHPSIGPASIGSAAEAAVLREKALQKLVTAFICTGLGFLLLPGTFLGVWNLIAISGNRLPHSLSPAWIQAHGQAQIFGWIGAFVIGIGFYSLSKMGRLQPFAVSRGWQSWALWTAGVAFHWATGVYGWEWRLMLPLSAFLMLAGFLIFFLTVRQHRAKPAGLPLIRRPQIWMRLVIASTIVFLVSLLLNTGGAVYVALRSGAPALPPALDQRVLLVSAWGFLVITIWGFNARWLPVFAGLLPPDDRGLIAALITQFAALVVGLMGLEIVCAVLLSSACVTAACSLHVFEPAAQRAKVQGIHPSFPHFVRAAYVWLLVAATLALVASLFDHNGGITGASRHALTVGFVGTMVFSIGCRVLPAFCGMRVLFSPRLMFFALAALNAGCLLRVASEIPAYESNLSIAWAALPVSAIAELTAVAVFVINLSVTLARPPAHLAAQSAASAR
jgi:hypothetical protein